MSSSPSVVHLRSSFPEVEADTIAMVLEYHGNDIAHAHDALVTMMTPIAAQSSKISLLSNQEFIDELSGLDRTLSPPFANIESKMCFVPELMRTSRMDDKIRILQTKAQQQGRRAFEDVAARLVKRAFGKWSHSTAKTFSGSDPGGLAHGNFYQGCLRVYRELDSWQRPLLQAALVELSDKTTTANKDDLQIICGLLLRAANECMARKQFAFTIVLDRSIPNTAAGPRTGGALDLHKATLFDAAKSAVDDLKDSAFRSTFTEPTKMYFRAVYDGTMEGDVEVHGSNTYLALLLAALGVKLTRTPLMDDDVKGVAPFNDGLRPQDLERVWAPENVGKSWETVLGRKEYPRVASRVRQNRFFFLGETPRQIAEDCLADGPRQDQARRDFEPYMRTFASFFAPDVAVERICNSFLAAPGLEPSLNAVFQSIASKTEAEEARGQAKFWLWDLMTGEFRLDRALALLQCAGICK